MCRYIAFSWQPDDHIASEMAVLSRQRAFRTCQWEVACDQRGLVILIEREPIQGRSIPLMQHAGAAVGTIFAIPQSSRETDPKCIMSFDDTGTRQLLSSCGRSIIDSHWGSYVLFLKDEDKSRLNVLRGPMSALSCFWISVNGLTAFASSVSDLMGLGLFRPTTNWDCIRAQAVGGDYLTTETAINEISTLLCGACLELKDGKLSHRAYWDPSTIHPSTTTTSVDEAAQTLRQSTQRCMDSWASNHRRILLLLSGGLDSSILLSCLNRASTRPEVVSVNFYSKQSGDERKFARSMTDRVGSKLVEVERDVRVDLRRFLDCSLTGNPVLNYSAYNLEPTMLQIAHEHGATAIMNGELGDDIFGHSVGAEMLSECHWRTGFGRTFIRAAIDYAELKRVSLWKAIQQSLEHLKWQKQTGYFSTYLYARRFGYTNHTSLVSEQVHAEYAEMLPRFIHPWFRNFRDMPPGRMQLLHGLTITTSTWSHPVFAGSESSMFMMPLASQPLVETYMRIPSHFHFSGGENGAVVRNAFSRDLSELVLNRGTGKGTPQLWIRDVVDRNRQFLRDVLLGGILVREHILDETKLEQMLSGAVSKSQVGVGELIKQLYIESWLRKFESYEAREAA